MNTSPRIICISDPLRGVRSFPSGFFDLVREPIKQGTGISAEHPPGGKRPHNLGANFSLETFRQLMGLTVNATASAQQEHWTKTYYNAPSIAVDYLFENIAKNSIILSFEIPPWLANACIDRGITFIDIRPSPLRFGRDLYMALRCSSLHLSEQISKFHVPDEELRLEAAILGANVRLHKTRLEDERNFQFEELNDALLFVGQAPYDASLLSPNGQSLRCTDFPDKLRYLSQGRRLLYKSHPFAQSHCEQECEALRKLTGKIPKIVHQNAYQILSSEDDFHLSGISSGLLQEAEWFEKSAHILFQPYVPLRNISNIADNKTYQQIHFHTILSPTFWHTVIAPEQPSPKISALPNLAHNHARETIDQWWDYSKVLTWERAFPHESFMRGGGAYLHQKIDNIALPPTQAQHKDTVPISPDKDRWENLDIRHLSEQKNPIAAADLFKRSVKMVELEIFSYCNRRCWFCPNSSIDRISTNNHMPEQMYLDILQQLASIGYDGTITYSRYNEPLADKIILERIRQAREKLPRATLHTNTNGDYLNNEYLKELYDAGLNSINIQIYLGNNEPYNHQKIKSAGEKTIKRVALQHTLIRDEPGLWYEHRLHYKDMAIRLYGRNFETGGTSRGGQVPIHLKHVRTSPCLIPFWAVYIDHNGSTVPCCNFRSDVPAHAEYVIGSLQEQPNLFLQYASRFAADFRSSLIGEDPKKGLCNNCFYAEESPEKHQQDRLTYLLNNRNQ